MRVLTPSLRALCPRCRKRPIAPYGGRGPLPKYCGTRSCYDQFYDRNRQAAKDAMRTEAVQLAVLAEGNRLRKEMLRKVVLVVGTEAKSGSRITERLPRGGALVILSRRERNEVLDGLALLDRAVEQAISALSKSRLRQHRAIASDLADRRPILDILGADYLLGEIPEPRQPRTGR